MIEYAVHTKKEWRSKDITVKCTYPIRNTLAGLLLFYSPGWTKVKERFPGSKGCDKRHIGSSRGKGNEGTDHLFQTWDLMAIILVVAWWFSCYLWLWNWVYITRCWWQEFMAACMRHNWHQVHRIPEFQHCSISGNHGHGSVIEQWRATMATHYFPFKVHFLVKPLFWKICDWNIPLIIMIQIN